MIKKAAAVLSLTMYVGLGVLAQMDGQLELAQQFLANGEYEKAKVIYEKIYPKNDNVVVYMDYYKTLLALSEYDELEKIIQKRLKKYSSNIKLHVDLGKVYSQKGDKEKAENSYQKAIDDLPKQQGNVVQLANEFVRIARYDLAIRTYEYGKKLLNNEDLFQHQLATMYQRDGNYDKYVENYLKTIEKNPRGVQNLKNTIMRSADKQAAFDALEEQLYTRIQKDQNNSTYPELLAWLFMQQDDFESAFIQLKALDKRFSEDGIRILQFGMTTLMEEQYDVAVDAFQYLVDKGPGGVHYFAARKGLLDAGKNRIYSNPNYQQQDLLSLDVAYANLIDDMGINSQTAQLVKDYSQLNAFYIHDLAKAIELIQVVLDLPHISEKLRAAAKIDLGDYFLLTGERWESMLLYGQVDKAMKDSPIGELARFKNAKIHYYNGNFELAQYQLKVLKSATSELVANDALELSIFITDNLGLDSIMDPMLMFARADLLAYQNKDDESIKTLDSIDFVFPNHVLSDDITFKRGELALKAHRFEEATSHFQNVYDQFPTDLLADNALFQLGELYEYFLNNEEEAKRYYEKIILEYPDSIFITEARKRFRKLRGDSL